MGNRGTRDVPRTIRHHTVSLNSEFRANRLNPLHFPVSRSNDIHSIIVIDSNVKSMLPFPMSSLHHLLPSVAAPIAPLPKPLANVHPRPLTTTRFPLESAFTKKPGGGVIMVNQRNSGNWATGDVFLASERRLASISFQLDQHVPPGPK